MGERGKGEIKQAIEKYSLKYWKSFLFQFFLAILLLSTLLKTLSPGVAAA